MSTITERVAAGAAFLDEHDPGWWRADVERAIDLDKLALDDSEMCVLGQRCPLEVLAGDVGVSVGNLIERDNIQRYYAYGYALMAIVGNTGALHYWAKEHGFTAGRFTRNDTGSWGDLTAEWKRVITGRRAAP